MKNGIIGNGNWNYFSSGDKVEVSISFYALIKTYDLKALHNKFNAIRYLEGVPISILNDIRSWHTLKLDFYKMFSIKSHFENSMIIDGVLKDNNIEPLSKLVQRKSEILEDFDFQRFIIAVIFGQSGMNARILKLKKTSQQVLKFTFVFQKFENRIWLINKIKGLQLERKDFFHQFIDK
ncbi:hypothetical protein [Ferruginibacter sp. HRS2-29]|uniref:hypothetical protein n=1 Tax=Ferruginibacter sp. HRS2-29 TaxID=2487334 RepID=UPI0020CCFA30|nr:hypothetical protein [Ferruginibacter sp. HRS2-29]MCP9749997.1 hypothetical protein [Ferruginibacter sp. HRS2-29]